jgi:glycosyltransferase involved in cell wall biosynthesis
MEDQPDVYALGELRHHEALGLLRFLRKLRVDTLVLAVEDENGAVVLPVLQVLAAIVPAKHRTVFDSKLQSRKISRAACIRAAFVLLAASLTVWISVFRAWLETRKYLRADLQKFNRSNSGNLLYLNANLWFGVKAGGSVGHISGVANGFLEQGMDVTFASVGGRLLVKDEASYVHLTTSRNFAIPWELNCYRLGQDFVQQLADTVAGVKPEFIYQRLSVGNYTGITLSRNAGVPLVLEYNGSEVWAAKHWGKELITQGLAEDIEAANLQHAHLIVTVSDVLKDELLERGIPAERIVSYPNCIDPETFTPDRFSREDTESLRARHGITKDAVVVTFVGTFGQWHGASVLARAIARILDADEEWVSRSNLHFLMVGDGLQMREVKETLGSHVNGGRVALTGLVPQTEAPWYLASSDILASPHVENADGSRFFGSPTKLFEYMAMGKAIVASELDQIGEVLSDGVRPDDYKGLSVGSEVSFLTQPGNVDQLVEAIKVLAQDPSTRARLGANARQLALRKYTWKHHVQAIFDGLDAL